MRQLQYLQSLEDRSGAETPDAADELRILLEVALALALGRDVVVPQADAFGSLAFLRVARDVLIARDATDSTEPLFRQYRPDVPSFDQVLGRLHDSERIDDERAELLAIVQREFTGRPAVVGRPWVVQPLLNELLLDLVTTAPGMAKVVAASSRPVAEVWQELRSAAHMLDPRRTGVFERRAQLHVDEPWPGDPGARSPAEIVGRDRLMLLLDYVDTAAAQLTAGAIGGRLHATFTTSLIGPGESVAHRATAQALALAGYQLKVGGNPHPLRSTTEPTTGFQLAVPTGDDAVARLRDELVAQLPAIIDRREGGPFAAGNVVVGPKPDSVAEGTCSASVSWPGCTLTVSVPDLTSIRVVRAVSRTVDLAAAPHHQPEPWPAATA